MKRDECDCLEVYFRGEKYHSVFELISHQYNLGHSLGYSKGRLDGLKSAIEILEKVLMYYNHKGKDKDNEQVIDQLIKELITTTLKGLDDETKKN